jgi:hypothetical protein
VVFRMVSRIMNKADESAASVSTSTPLSWNEDYYYDN